MDRRQQEILETNQTLVDETDQQKEVVIEMELIVFQHHSWLEPGFGP